MEKSNIHHRIRSIGRDFTFSEWCDYLKNEKPQDDIVFVSPDGYKFNHCDICKNPDVSANVRTKDPFFFFKVTTCRSPNGRYDYGITYSTGSGGGGHGCSFVDDINKGYASRDEAIKAGLQRIRGHVEYQADLRGQSEQKVRDLLTKVNEAIKSVGRKKVVQLELFG